MLFPIHQILGSSEPHLHPIHVDEPVHEKEHRLPAVDEGGDPAAPGGLRAPQGELGRDVEVLLPEPKPEPAQVQVRLREEQDPGEEGGCGCEEAGADCVRRDLSDAI